MRSTKTSAALGLSVVLLATGCGSGQGEQEATGTPAITVDASDTACTLSTTKAATGTVPFVITNKGSKVTEFYVYGQGDRIIGEVENIAPGLTRKFTVDIAKPGSYVTACKPGMTGSGIRGTLVVTGAAAPAAATSDPKLTAATTGYKKYVDAQADLLLTRTASFAAAVKAGDVAKAKRLYPQARLPWERIEPVAASFGDLDPKIDGRADVVDQGMAFTGYHRLEKDLWKDGLRKDSGAVAAQLLTDVRQTVTRSKALTYNPLQLANGSTSLLDEMATGKVTGEEERYSHTDLYDFSGNFEGAKAALQALAPVIEERDPALATALQAKERALSGILAQHRRGAGFVSYTALTRAQVKALSDALDAFSEQVAKVAGVVAQR